MPPTITRNSHERHSISHICACYSCHCTCCGQSGRGRTGMLGRLCPLPRRMELNAGRFPSCTEDRAEEPPPGPLGGALGRDRHGCRFRDDRHRRQPAHRGSRHPDRHGHVPTQGRQKLPRRHHLFQSMRRPRLGQAIMPSRPVGGRWKSHPSTPSTHARKRLASARSSSPIAACRCGSSSQVGPRVNHGAIVCSRFLPPP